MIYLRYILLSVLIIGLPLPVIAADQRKEKQQQEAESPGFFGSAWNKFISWWTPSEEPPPLAQPLAGESFDKNITKVKERIGTGKGGQGKGDGKKPDKEEKLKKIDAQLEKLKNEPEEVQTSVHNAYNAFRATKDEWKEYKRTHLFVNPDATKEYENRLAKYSRILEKNGYGDLIPWHHGATGDKDGPAMIAHAKAQAVPNSAIAQRGWMKAEGDRGNWQAMQEAGMRAIGLSPDKPEAYTGVAKASYEMGDYETAYQYSMRAAQMNPYDAQAKSINKLAVQRLGGKPGATVGGTTTAQGPPAAAPTAPSFDKLNNRVAPSFGGPTSEQLRAAKYQSDNAMTLLQQGDSNEAIKAADNAIRLNPRNVKAHIARIKAYERIGDYQAMLRAARQALEHNSNNSLLLAMQAGAFNHLGQFKDALASAGMAIRADSKNPEAYLQKAWAIDGMGGSVAERNRALELAYRYGGAGTKYQQIWEQADELGDGELAAWLAGESLKPREKAGPAAGEGPGKRRIFMLGLASVVGGFLIALGFLRSAKDKWRDFLRRITILFSRESPGVEGYDAVRGLPGGNGASEFVSDTLLRNYDVEREVGEGGMGVVYLGTDRALRRKVAIKKMRDEIRVNARERERFISEARTVATLHHPNIVEIFSIVEDGRDAFLIFEFVDGKTVYDILHKKKRMSYLEAVSILKGAAAALDYAHRHNVVHRDLKPSNIMVSKEGQVKVMDFGVARMAKDSLSRVSRTNTVVGTPPYMAPEQEQGRVKSQSDVYALAVMLYEMVTGQLPFEGVGAGMLMAKINKTFVPAGRLTGGLPEGFDAVMDRAFEPEPEKRWRTAGEFLRNLEALALPR